MGSTRQEPAGRVRRLRGGCRRCAAPKKAKKKLLKVSVNYDGPVEAPINKDQKVATLKVVYDQELVGEYDLLASKEIKKVNFFSRLLKSLNYLIWGDV